VKRFLAPPPQGWEEFRLTRQWARDERGGARSLRSPQQRDRDRILYSSALQRLSYITQVTAPEAGHSFHNRLGHSLKVAQVGRRNVERLRTLAENGEIAGKGVEAVLAVDPDAVEAACLAHDLGHPPFGHIAEEELCACVKEHVQDGFEGNAQSFRIVTRLAVRNDRPGLDLTRETLDSMLKYPWKHWAKPPRKGDERREKWGYYEDDVDAFKFARELWPAEVKKSLPEKSLGAEIMDWADDLTYAVHDVDDFYRAGLIPLERLRNPDDAELKRLATRLEELRDADAARFPDFEIEHLVETVREILSRDGPSEPYTHTKSARADLRELGSELITRYLEAFHVDEGEGDGKAELEIDDDARREVMALKLLVRVYVIHRPSLAVVQHGQRRVIGELFKCYFAASDPEDPQHLLPPGTREQLSNADGSGDARARAVADLIAGLTETAAVQIHDRLCGWGDSTALDATALIG